MTRAAKIVVIPIFLLQLLLFVFIARHRFVDTDEGYYLLASRLVLMHKKPYVDFFFQQAPLLPYVYALWLKLFHVTWSWARLLPALLTALLGLLLYEDVCRQTRQWLAGLASTVLFATSTLVFAWMPIAKPYSLAGLFLFAAYTAVTRKMAKPSRWLLAAGGLSLALAVDTRSYLVLTAPLFLWWIARNFPARLKSTGAFLVGFGIGLLPSLYLFLSSPAAFLFDNLGYHAIRTDAGLVGMWGQKVGVLLMLLLGSPEGNGIQNCLLLVISLAFVFSISKSDWPPRLAFQLALLLAAVSLLPTPVLPQYFSFCIPFLIVSAVCVVSHLISNIEIRRQLVAASACLILTGIYVAFAIGDFRKYLITGNGIPTVRTLNDPDTWRLERIEQVSRAINQIARPGETVASFWSGYLFQTHAAPLAGLETDCGILIADKLSSQQRTHYHIVSWPELDASFAASRPRVVVLENHQGLQNMLVPDVLGNVAVNALLSRGYAVAQAFGDTAIYVCCSRSDATKHPRPDQPTYSGTQRSDTAATAASAGLRNH